MGSNLHRQYIVCLLAPHRPNIEAKQVFQIQLQGNVAFVSGFCANLLPLRDYEVVLFNCTTWKSHFCHSVL